MKKIVDMASKKASEMMESSPIRRALVFFESRVLPGFEPRAFWRPLALFIALPTLLAAFYYGLIAADQYQTEAMISVRSSRSGGVMPSLGGLLSVGGVIASGLETDAVAQFVASHDAVSALDKELDLRTVFRRPEADWIARLTSNATLEQLVSYYNGMVEAAFDLETGTATIKVKAFRPEDARNIAAALIKQSEALVNSLNKRAEDDALELARSELARATQTLSIARQRLRDFRLKHGDIDPEKSSSAIGEIIASIEQEKAETAIALGQLESYMNSSSPQVEALRKKKDALDAQISREQKRLTGEGGAMTNVLAEYEALRLDHELANRGYTSAIASLEAARIEAMKKRSYVVQIVAPHVPEEAEFPRRFRSVFFVFVGCSLLYGIGRLLVSGVRDHVIY